MSDPPTNAPPTNAPPTNDRLADDRLPDHPPTSDRPALRLAPPPFLAEPAFAALLAALPDARVVGGAVRDALADRPIADIDLATKLPPTEVMAALQRAGIRAVPTGLAHGTVTAVLDAPRFPLGFPPGFPPGGPLDGPLGGRRSVEITTLRRDVATDGRHATVAFTDDWRQDAARRDFTVNAMSMTRDGAVHDYFGGIADLRAGTLRFVGDPARRIAEDTLRVLRYFRFFARYAAIPPEPSVRAALQAGIPGFSKLSAERVWSELLRILAAPDPGAAVALMAELGILAAVIPEGADPAALARLLAAGAPADPLLRLAALLTGEVERFADRLRLSAAERQRLLDLRATPLARPEDDDATLRRLLADHDRAALIDRTWLTHALPANPAAPDWPALRARLARLPHKVFPLQGSDVLALGVQPGPRVGALLRATRAWWLAGGCTAGVEDCRAELARALSRTDAPAGQVAGHE
jgi:poly(A) polymerase/tRNA nucleotidyltransferase (CCA-adding enzyme)